jgi:hypothetical protein
MTRKNESILWFLLVSFCSGSEIVDDPRKRLMLRRPRLGGVIVLTLLMLLLLPAALLAVDFPNKPINLIVPYAAAGAIPAADLA